MKYLRIEAQRPRIGVFDFTSCEGCELQLLNHEESLVDFLACVELVNFREASSVREDSFDIALVEGSISRADEVERLEWIRARARTLVAFGSCACFGGVNRLKNACDLAAANREVYGDHPKETLPVRAISEVVAVDLEIPGCPVSKREVERIVQHLMLDVPFQLPVYPVCVDCKQRFTSCMFERGRLCLGSISRAGCDAPCPAGGLGCWGCRGPALEANLSAFRELARERGFSEREVAERLAFFGGFESAR